MSNYLFLGKSIRGPEYYYGKVASAVRTNSCIVVETEKEMDAIKKVLEEQNMECECIYMREFIERRSSKGVK